MSSSNENKFEHSTAYDPNAALQFFKLFGKVETVKQGEIIFSQGQKANRFLLQHDKIYLLVKGVVHIQVASATIASVKPGDVFGEITPLTFSLRSATAVAETPCKLIALSEKQLLAGLKKKPEFALMLMGLLVKWLRQAVIKSKDALVSTEYKNSKRTSVFNSSMLAELVEKLGYDAVINVPQQRVIFQEGGTGMLMYVILEGFVTATIGDKVVERSGRGGVIGEIALIDQKRRVASVIAETPCSLLAINRQAFLELVETQPVFGVSLLRALASRLYLCRTGYPCTPAHSLFTGF